MISGLTASRKGSMMFRVIHVDAWGEEVFSIEAFNSMADAYNMARLLAYTPGHEGERWIVEPITLN